jgi:hypothetical protein
MSGGKGGSSTTEVKIPEYIEAAAQRNLNKAERISQLGYVPQYGPDVAAFTPMQQASFQNTADAANAFGMAAPTSQRDIMGGMDAPTTYAGGVQGYSSAPMYQQSIDALAAARPAQKSYIDSFFIDPTTGNYAYQPMDYTQYGTNAANDRAAAAAAAAEAAANRGNQLEIARLQAAGTALSAPEYNTYVNTIQEATSNPSYNPATDVLTPTEQAAIAQNPEAQLAQDNLYMNIIADAGGGGDYSFSNPSPTGSYGGSLTTGQPSAANQAYFDSVNSGSSSSANANSGGGYTSIGDMFDGGGPGTSGDTFGGAVGGVSNAVGATPAGSGGEGGGGGDKVICTALHELGRLSDDVYALDAEFGLRVNSEDPMLGDGYRLWATSVANYIKGDSIGSKIALAIVSPVAKAWAAEMAHVMRPEEYKPNVFGKALMAIGHPICRMIGKVFLPKMNKEAV